MSRKREGTAGGGDGKFLRDLGRLSLDKMRLRGEFFPPQLLGRRLRLESGGISSWKRGVRHGRGCPGRVGGVQKIPGAPNGNQAQLGLKGLGELFQPLGFPAGNRLAVGFSKQGLKTNLTQISEGSEGTLSSLLCSDPPVLEISDSQNLLCALQPPTNGKPCTGRGSEAVPEMLIGTCSPRRVWKSAWQVPKVWGLREGEDSVPSQAWEPRQK